MLDLLKHLTHIYEFFKRALTVKCKQQCNSNLIWIMQRDKHMNIVCDGNGNYHPLQTNFMPSHPMIQWFQGN